MLILIAGITGNIGAKLLDSLVKRGHSIRGLSRSKSKLSQSQLSSLESFHESSSWYDVPAIRAAVRGVDAVVCAYGPFPVLILDAELLLVRIMEEEGVTRFVPCSWNMDWSRLPWDAVPAYNVFHALQSQLAMSSTVKPLYIFVGALAETYFSVPGHGGFSPAQHGIWDPNGPTAELWATGDEKWQITTEGDTAEFTAELVTDLTKKEGFYRFCGFEASFKEIAKIYEEERGKPVKLVYKGSLEDLKQIAEKTKKELGLPRFWEWMGYFYQVHSLDDSATMKSLDNDMFPDVRATSFKDFLKQNPEI